MFALPLKTMLMSQTSYFLGEGYLTIGRVLHHGEDLPVGGHVPAPLHKINQVKNVSARYF